MNDLARVSAPGIPDRLFMPALPAPAASYLARLDTWAEERARFAAAKHHAEVERRGHPDAMAELSNVYVSPKPRLPVLTDNDRAAIAAAIADLEARLAPISAARLGEWLAPINAAVRNPQNRDDFTTRVRGMAEVLNDLPMGAFTAEARRALALDFFPGAGEIRRAVQAGADALAAKRAALRDIEAPPAIPEPPPEPRRDGPRSFAEIVAVKQAAREVMAAATAPKPTERGPPARALPLSDGALLAHYERMAADGNRNAAWRAEQIRARLAQPETQEASA